MTIDSFKAWLAQNAGVIGATAGSLLAGWTSLVGGTIGFTSAPLADHCSTFHKTLFATVRLASC